MAKQNSTKHRGNPTMLNHVIITQGSVKVVLICVGMMGFSIKKKKKTIEDPRLYNSNSTSLLFLENIVTILKCTKHNLTKEVIFYKMTFKSSLFAALEVVREYCSTAHHS